MTIVLNVIALWKQEARGRLPALADGEASDFFAAWHDYAEAPGARRTLIAIGFGTAAFSMQDILLEPYGGEVLGFTVGETTALTGMLAAGTLAGFAVAANQLTRGNDTYRIAALGVLVGLIAFPTVLLAGATDSGLLFRIGTVLIGYGTGLFSVGSLTAAMAIATRGGNGMALGAWGAVTATAAGLAIAFSGAIRDTVSALAHAGDLGAAFQSAAAGYNVVYLIELMLLFATLVAIGPLVGRGRLERRHATTRFGIAEFPG